MSGLRAMPVLSTRDVVALAEFYEGLGFEKGSYWGDPPGFCILCLGTITVALQRTHDDVVSPNPYWDAYLYVADVAALHERFRAAEAVVTEIRRDNPYGCDDFDLTDPEGHTLAFGQDKHPSPQGPGL